MRARCEFPVEAFEGSSRGPDAMTRTRFLKALVIDDEPVVLSCVRLLLQRRGYEVSTYQSPLDSPLGQFQSCPCLLHSACPDVIISDLDMPDMTGIQFLEGLFAKGCRCRHAALISGKGLKETDLVRMAKLGIRYFIKPLDLAQFYAWLDGVESDAEDVNLLDSGTLRGVISSRIHAV